MKEILIVNLTRMGDLIQTTPVLAGLKKKYPDARITLLVNSVFREICKDLPFIDNLVICDMVTFREMRPGEEQSLVECYRRFEEFIDEVNQIGYDLAVNFTPSAEASVLTSLFNAREVRGVTTGADGARVVRHPWQRYFMGVNLARRYNPFHLCDMMIRAAEISPAFEGLRLSVSEGESARARALLSQFGVGDDDLLVGFQLGASQELRSWPASSFARLGDRLAESLKARVLLIGSISEEELGREYESAAVSKAVNLVGKTSLRELAALLKRCSLLVTNDTGPLHMATAVGTTAIELPFGHACFRETGPYGENHYVIEAKLPCIPCGHHVKCDNPRCKEMVAPDAVFELASRVLSGRRVETIEESPLWEDVRVFRSFFAPDGMLDFIPLKRLPLTPEMFWLYLYRETWPFILDGAGGFSAEKTGDAVRAKVSAWHGEEDLTEVLRAIGEDFSALNRMRALAGDALKKISLIRKEAARPSPDVRLIQRVWKGAPAIDREIETLGRTHPALMPPVVLFKFGKEALEGKELAPMAETAAGLYSDLEEHFSMLAAAIRLLLEKHAGAARGSCDT